MPDQIDLEEAGPVVVPVGEGANRGCPLGSMMLEERTGFGRCPPARQGGTAGGGEQAVGGGRTQGEKERAGIGGERQFAVPFHRVDQRGETGDETLATDPARDLPQLREVAPQRRRIARGARSPDRARTRGRRMTQESHRIFAMVAGRRDELVEDVLFLRARRRDVARRDDR
jgi:hypothetical protein